MNLQKIVTLTDEMQKRILKIPFQVATSKKLKEKKKEKEIEQTENIVNTTLGV